MRDALELQRTLAEDAEKYDFFQALRLIENAYPALPRIGESARPRDDAVRFGMNPDMIFQPNALAAFTPASADRPARLALNFFGLLGANGPLPLHLTEYARDRERNLGDATFARFLDIFHHRLASLFYRARAAAEPTVSLDRAEADRFSTFVGSMFGIGAPGLRERDAIPDFAKLHFAGLLASKTRNAAGLVTILREFFKFPVALEQFVGQWMPLPLDGCSRLGALDGSCLLGTSTVLGKHVWDCQNKFRIVIGPIDYIEYQRMLPGGGSMQRLLDWVRNYVGDHLDWDVRLILEKSQVPTLSLGGVTRLGWSSWIGKAARQNDARDVLLTPLRQGGGGVGTAHVQHAGDRPDGQG